MPRGNKTVENKILDAVILSSKRLDEQITSFERFNARQEQRDDQFFGLFGSFLQQATAYFAAATGNPSGAVNMNANLPANWLNFSSGVNINESRNVEAHLLEPTPASLLNAVYNNNISSPPTLSGTPSYSGDNKSSSARKRKSNEMETTLPWSNAINPSNVPHELELPGKSSAPRNQTKNSNQKKPNEKKGKSALPKKPRVAVKVKSNVSVKNKINVHPINQKNPPNAIVPVISVNHNTTPTHNTNNTSPKFNAHYTETVATAQIHAPHHQPTNGNYALYESHNMDITSSQESRGVSNSLQTSSGMDSLSNNFHDTNVWRAW